MEKNKKTNIYINEVMYENFQSIAISSFKSKEIKQLNENMQRMGSISYSEALKCFFENGLDINNYLIDSERYNNSPITMIEDLTIVASNSEAVLIAYENISKDFFKSLPYRDKKSIAYNLTTKAFFSDGDIEYLLKTLYSKGFRIEQEPCNSLEIDWILTQKIDLLRVLFREQQDFDFDFKYKYEGREIDFTSIISLEIVKLKNQKEMGYELKILSLEQILEEANSLILYQTLCNANDTNSPYIEDEDFKL